MQAYGKHCPSYYFPGEGKQETQFECISTFHHGVRVPTLSLFLFLKTKMVYFLFCTTLINIWLEFDLCSEFQIHEWLINFILFQECLYVFIINSHSFLNLHSMLILFRGLFFLCGSPNMINRYKCYLNIHLSFERMSLYRLCLW